MLNSSWYAIPLGNAGYQEAKIRLKGGWVEYLFLGAEGKWLAMTEHQVIEGSRVLTPTELAEQIDRILKPKCKFKYEDYNHGFKGRFILGDWVNRTEIEIVTPEVLIVSDSKVQALQKLLQSGWDLVDSVDIGDKEKLYFLDSNSDQPQDFVEYVLTTKGALDVLWINEFQDCLEDTFAFPSRGRRIND